MQNTLPMEAQHMLHRGLDRMSDAVREELRAIAREGREVSAVVERVFAKYKGNCQLYRITVELDSFVCNGHR